MPDQPDNDAPTTETTAESTPEERKFSQAEVDRIVQERLARERKGNGSSKTRTDTPPAAQSSDERLSLKQIQAEMQADRIEREFDRMALREKLSEEQADTLRPIFKVWRMSAGDADGATWLRSIRGAFGTPTPTPPKPPQTPNGPPVSDAGSPSAPTVVTEDTPLLQLSAEDRNHLRKQKGDAWYNATLRQQLKGVRVVLRKP